MSASDDEATKLVNAAGFLFQLRVEHELTTQVITPGSMWKIAAREHRWVHSHTDAQGYIDLILDTGTVFLVIECKRVSDGLWAFLCAENASPMQRARLLWTHRSPDSEAIADWSDFTVTPSSPEAMFCVVRGHGEDNIPMLERIASNLMLAAEALAEEDLALNKGSELAHSRVFIPVLVTNAELRVVRYKPGSVDLGTGRLDSANSEQVLLIRFRKSLTSAIPPRQSPSTIDDAAHMGERTVLVLKSDTLSNTFKKLDMPYKSWPWEHI